MKTINKNLFKKAFSLILVFLLTALLFSGCKPDSKSIKLNPNNPVTISIWHYYNGPILNAFDSMIQRFNETIGATEGIIIEGFGMGNTYELEKAIMSSAKSEVGSLEMPNVFASYSDTAYEADKMGLLANLDHYLTKNEQKEYLDSYIEEGKIGQNGELLIFPIAKSTEIFMINETDWIPFAEANGLSYNDLSTIEDITRVAEIYYNWTDAKTPDVPNDGKSFYGRDVMANFFIIASKSFGIEIFNVKNGTAEIIVDEAVMRNIWDNYYVPFISGYFSAYGKFRSDDAKVGDILCYVGSTASAAYFPKEVSVDGKVYPIESKIFPAPGFKNAEKVMVQQGAGMVVTKSTPEEEYASVVFLKWFTEAQQNIEFAALSGYMPVKKDAADYDNIIATLEQNGLQLSELANNTLKIALDEIKISELYTNKAFNGGIGARAVLENNLHNKAITDRELILSKLENGTTLYEAVSQLNTDENFYAWLADITSALNIAAGKQESP